MPWPLKWVVAVPLLALLSIALIAILHGVGIAAALVIGIVATGIFGQASENRKLAAMTPQQRADALARKQRERAGKEASRMQRAYGPLNPALICPHCQTKGSVRTRQTDVKAGISGGKATAAVLTGGFSLLATGLSRMQHLTAARCGECGSSWTF
jgi:uncharacterized paraquat-inducible protein A